MTWRVPAALPLVLLALSAPPAAAQALPLPDWVAADSAGHTVTFTLTTTAGDSGAAINGYRHGAIQLVVPLGWTVKWNWVNRDSTASHSLVVMAEREKLPLEGGRPALDNAMSRAVTTGLKPGQKDVTTFTADQAGWYWLLCGVRDHAIGGEWIGLKVDREAGEVGIVRKE